MRRFIALLLCCALSLSLAPVPAGAWSTPAQGTQLRRDLMDAIRPHAEWMFGRPVVFIVDDLRVAGDVGFAMLTPVRPSGQPLNAFDLQPYIGPDQNPFGFGDESMQVLYQRSGQTWVAVHWAIGATDVWYSWEPYCFLWYPVIPEVC
jgi:hypothetical protein